MSLRHVPDPDDPALEPYRAVRDRDLAGRPGRFVAEGRVVLEHLVGPRSRFAVESILVAANRRPDVETLLARVSDAVPVLVADRRVMDGIVGFPIHRGLLAIGRRGDPPPLAALLPPQPAAALVVVLIGIANHDNVGGTFRNAAAFGADAVLLDSGSCDPLYRKAIRVSVGAAVTVPFRRGGIATDILAALRDDGFDPVALSPSGETPLSCVRWSSRTALVIGPEGAGLPPDLLRDLRTVSIPMAPGFDSLNLATATGIALHAVRTSRAQGD